MKKLITAAIAATVMTLGTADALACTNMLVGKKASVNGATMISYNADSHTLYGELYFTPAADHAPGAMRKVTEWDTGKPLGMIPQPDHTYRVVGNVNEWQVTIAESTWGGRHDLSDEKGIIDYGSLIYIALERSKTAREAIDIMTSLVAEYGYYSSGETFSIGDPDEIWVMDLVGKGKDNKGAVWVAQRIPDDCISAHANQARIHKFPQAKKKLNKKLNRYEVGDSCIYSAELIPFARTLGYEGSDEEFDFAATFGDQDYGAYRGCDGRVWAFFNRYAKGMERYFDFVDMVEGAEVLPLYVKADRLLSHRDIQDALGDHFEGTPWDMTKDVGGGPFHSPYRWRPMHFEVDGVEYTHERAIGTQQTGFTFVSEMRGWLPREIGAKQWFGVDDAATAVFCPIYNNIIEAPLCFRVGNGDMLTFSWTSAFWMTNWVTNQCYSRYEDMKVDVDRVRNALMDRWDEETDKIDAAALELLKNSSSDVTAFLNEYSAKESNGATEAYKDLGIYLLVKYLDGNIKREKDGEFERTEYGMPKSPMQPKYSDEFYRAIVNQIGDKIKVKK